MSDGPMFPWTGDPVFKTPSRCNDDRNTWRVFHRDIPGRIIAEFYGDRAGDAAVLFCQMFGEESGFQRKEISE